jgi:predicted nuclease of predicted toxin-antitoxin system
MIRLLADEDADRRIVRGLRRRVPAIDFVLAQDSISQGTPDPEVLRLAKNLGRILVSHDVDTMPAHFYRFLTSQDSPGIILIKQRYPVGRAIADLELLCLCCTPDEFLNRITYIPDR